MQGGSVLRLDCCQRRRRRRSFEFVQRMRWVSLSRIAEIKMSRVSLAFCCSSLAGSKVVCVASPFPRKNALRKKSIGESTLTSHCSFFPLSQRQCGERVIALEHLENRPFLSCMQKKQ